MESGELVRLKRVKALSGTALAGVELLTAFEVELLGANALEGAVSTPEESVYAAVAVVALVPADTELEDAYDVEAPAPDVPDEALAWMYRLDNLLGSL
jgi:hypothetical protein